MPGRDVSAQSLINHLGLVPLPEEGGFYRQTVIAPDPGNGSFETPAATAILYLLTPESRSALHVLDGAELYHFYMGDPVHLVSFSQERGLERIELGHDVLGGQRVQHLVPEFSWHGSTLAPGGSWALLGTTMTPGYRASGFALVRRQELENLVDDVADILRPFLSDAQ